MSDMLQTDRVVYVEPNLLDEVNTFNSEGQTVYKSIEQENLSIVVMLEVEAYGRTFASSPDGKSMSLQWQTSGEGDKISFMEGSKIYTNKEKTEYIKSLTTNYTDCSLIDMENGGTCEMFGISSIDINYNQYMVPEVDIKFTDVRGVSLFGQEEMRHNLVEKGVTASVNNSIEGSFFKSFFAQPYPKFTLKVKGFYGQMVSYELLCEHWKGVFNGETGNYDVNARFIGFYYSFLNNLALNPIVAAPYSEYVGRDYWETRLNDSFTLVGKNGSKVPMVTLGQLCRFFREAQEKVAEQLEKDPASIIIENGGTQDDVNALNLVDNKELDDTIELYKSRLKALYNAMECKEESGDWMYIIPNTLMAIIVSDKGSVSINGDSVDVEDDCVNLANILTNKITSVKDKTGNEWMTNWVKNHSFTVYYESDIDNAFNPEVSQAEMVKKDSNLPEEAFQVLKKQAIIKKGNQTYGNLWCDWDNSHIYVINDYGFGKEYYSKKNSGVNNNTTSNTNDGETSDAKTEIMEKWEQKAIQNTLQDQLNFQPSVENMTKIIMAHVETFVEMIKVCMDNIRNQGTERSMENLKVSLSDFGDLSNQGMSEANIVIPPFPQAIQDIERDGILKKEEAWLGDMFPGTSFEEVQLIEGLLKGIEKVGFEIERAQSLNTKEEVNVHTTQYPLIFSDYLVKGEDKLFGDINFKNVDDIAAKIAMRGYVVLSMFEDWRDGDGVATNLGMIDAYNFTNSFQTSDLTDEFKQFLHANSSTQAENIIKYITYQYKKGNNSSIFGKHKNNPWYKNPQLFKIYDDNKKISLNVGTYDSQKYNTSILPIKNLNWLSLSKMANKDKIIGNKWDDFIITNSPYNGGKKELELKENVAHTLILDKDVTITEKLFNETKSLDKCNDKIRETYSDYIVTKDEYHGTINDLKKHGSDESVKWEDLNFENGKLTNKLVWDRFATFYGRKEVYTQYRNTTEEAGKFIEALIGTGGWGTKVTQFQFDESNTKAFSMPKLIALAISRDFYSRGENKGYIRGVWYPFSEYYRKWLENDYPKIQKAFKMFFKDGKGYSDYMSVQRLSSGEISDGYKQILTNGDDFSKVYDLSQGTLTVKESSVMEEVLQDLLSVTTICSCDPYIDRYNPENVEIKTNALQSYIQGMIEVLQEKYGVDENTSLDEMPVQLTIPITSDPSDVKLVTYNYVKHLYDSWLASNPQEDFYTIESAFNGGNRSFHFVDSFYNKIGNSLLVNLQGFVDILTMSQKQDGISLLGCMSEFYRQNKLSFFCLQNFLDLGDSDAMETMFKPVSYLDLNIPNNHPDFIVLYPYEPSKHLASGDSDFPDDTFYLNEASTYPTMITSGRGENSHQIPSFGVSYGQQYQNYFKDVQVDMGNPLATEQSIRAKMLIAGVNTDSANNTTKEITIGQDLFSIYANNSYTCTVTMLGCAWVQPMMYFVLQNVPLFRGSYMIYKVSHHIQAGSMVTTFSGMRMAKTATKLVDTWIYGGTNDSNSLSEVEIFEHQNANVANNCSYAYIDPTPTSGTDFSNELNLKLYDVLPQKGKDLLDGKWGTNGKAFKNWSLLDALGAIAYQEFGGTSPAAVDQRDAVVACIYNYRGVYNKKGYSEHIFKSGWRYFVGDKPVFSGYRDNLLNISQNASKWDAGKDSVKRVFQNGPYHLVGKTNVLGGTVTKEQVQRCFITKIANNNSSSEENLKSYGPVLFQLPAVNGSAHTLIGLNNIPNGYVPKPEKVIEDDKKKSVLRQYAEGLVEALTTSMKTTDAYQSFVATTTYGKNDAWFFIKGNTDEANNALFDCAINTYKQWIEKIYWDYGSGQTSSNCKGIAVKVTKTEPKSTLIAVAQKCEECVRIGKNIKVVSITTKEGVNESLRLSMIKYLKNNGFNDATKAKSAFNSISSMANDLVTSTFELDKKADEDSVGDCNGLCGYPSSGFQVTGSGKLIKLTSPDVQITFDPKSDNPVSDRLVSYFQQVCKKAKTQGITSINISCTTNHSSNAMKSAHMIRNGARALDINKINGVHVNKNEKWSKVLQDVIEAIGGYSENYGPYYIWKIEADGSKHEQYKGVRTTGDKHYRHIHLAIPKA